MNMRGIPRYTLVCGARYTLGARYLSKNTVIVILFKLIISVRGDHCDYWTQAAKNLAMPLLRRNLKPVIQCKYQ